MKKAKGLTYVTEFSQKNTEFWFKNLGMIFLGMDPISL